MHALLEFAWPAECPWAWWWPSLRGWRTGWCPQTVRPSKPHWPPKWWRNEGTLAILINVYKFEQAWNCQMPYLQSSNSCTLETQICLEVLGDFPDQTLERQLPDQQLSGLLVPTDLTQSDGSWPANRQDFKWNCNMRSRTNHIPDKQKYSNILILQKCDQCGLSLPVSVGLLHSTCRWCTFPGCLCSQLLPRSLSSGGFTSGLLGTSHTLPDKQ